MSYTERTQYLEALTSLMLSLKQVDHEKAERVSEIIMAFVERSDKE